MLGRVLTCLGISKWEGGRGFFCRGDAQCLRDPHAVSSYTQPGLAHLGEEIVGVCVPPGSAFEEDDPVSCG